MSSQGSSGSSGSGSPADGITRIVGHLTTLVNQEIALVKTQVSEAGSRFGTAAGAGGAAAVVLLFVIGFLGLAGGAALTRVVEDWAAWLIVAGVFLVIALILLLIARSQAKKGAAAPAVATNQVKEDVEWVKQQIKR